MKRQILIFVTCFLLSASCSEERPLPSKSNGVACQVVGIQDGDTITVLTKNKKQYKIRLAHIDCPGKGQPFGNNAKQFTSDFCFKQTVSVLHNGKKDRNGRVIGVVINEQGENLNKALVQAGLAWHFAKYSDDVSYAQLETEARNARLGLWQEEDAVAPWLWRKGH